MHKNYPTASPSDIADQDKILELLRKGNATAHELTDPMGMLYAEALYHLVELHVAGKVYVADWRRLVPKVGRLYPAFARGNGTDVRKPGESLSRRVAVLTREEHTDYEIEKAFRASRAATQWCADHPQRDSLTQALFGPPPANSGTTLGE